MEQRDPRTYAVIGAALEVHRSLGPGFLEAVYQEALALELKAREIPFHSQVDLPVYYKEILLTSHYRADFICYEEVIIEIKAVAKLGDLEAAQILNYLKASKHPIGLLIHFGSPSMQYKRFILSTNSGVLA